MSSRDLAVTAYRNVRNCTEEAFEEDFYISQRLLMQIRKDGQQGKKINLPLCINYVITFFNLFEHKAAVQILTSLSGNETKKLLAFLVFLNKVPANNTQVDLNILESLQKHYGVDFL